MKTYTKVSMSTWVNWKYTDLATSGELAGMYALAFLGLANAMGGGSIGHARVVNLRAGAHVLSARHIGSGSKLSRFRRRRKRRNGRRVQDRSDLSWVAV